MRGNTFIPLSFLDQILSAAFLSKISKLFWRWKLTSIRLIWHPAKLMESHKKMLNGGVKEEHFSCSHSSCQWGLKRLSLYICILYRNEIWIWLKKSTCRVVYQWCKRLGARDLPETHHHGFLAKKFQINGISNALLQLNLHETNLLFRYLSHHLTWHCLLIYSFFPVFTSSCLLRSWNCSALIWKS